MSLDENYEITYFAVIISMDPTLYQDILLFKGLGDFPTHFPSTKSNFIAMCNRFQVNGANKLTRDNKLVLIESDLPGNLFNPH